MPKRIDICSVLIFVALSAPAQTNVAGVTNSPAVVSGAASQYFESDTNSGQSIAQRAEQIRAACIEGRRCICGKILQVLPDGLVVDSGYTNLLREPLTRSWFAPGTVSATRAANVVEGLEPNSVCIGPVFLTNLPKSRGAKPKLYDYVMIEGYPAGQHTYTSVGSVQKTVRAFSASLDSAVNWHLKNSQNQIEPTK